MIASFPCSSLFFGDELACLIKVRTVSSRERSMDISTVFSPNFIEQCTYVHKVRVQPILMRVPCSVVTRPEDAEAVFSRQTHDSGDLKH
jgi:hypothetical protein